jgi:cellulose synthase/poly-beta-1,6-N-acetylglucosamine synthase-like glycosyltransferase
MVSITVAVRDAEKWVNGCLQSLVDQSYPNIEIIAVNDGSSDSSGEYLQNWHDPEGKKKGIVVHVVQLPASGLSAARQHALKMAKGMWVAITDIDCRPHPTWIENLVKQSKGIDDEDVVSVAGRVIFEEGDTVVSRIRAQEIESKYLKRSRRTTLANGPCSMFLRERLLQIGGFNPEWYHAEDMEVSLKLVQSGGVIIYTPDAVVQHVAESSLRVFLRKRARDARAHMRIIRKYPLRKRQGPGFDFIGSSWFVLALAPILGSAFIQLLRIGLTDVEFDGSALGSQLMLAMIAIYLLLGVKLSKGYLGRGSLKTKISDSVQLPWILALWSLWLWKGITLGVMDAVFSKNGH